MITEKFGGTSFPPASVDLDFASVGHYPSDLSGFPEHYCYKRNSEINNLGLQKEVLS